MDSQLQSAALTPSDVKAQIARTSPVPNVQRALDRYALEVWVTNGEHGFWFAWSSCDETSRAIADRNAMRAAGHVVVLLDRACGGRRVP